MKKAEMLHKTHLFASDLTITPSNGYRSSNESPGKYTNHAINNTSSQPINLSMSSSNNVTPLPSLTPIPSITSTASNAGYKRPRQIFTLQQEEQLAAYVRDTANYYSGLSSKEVRIMAFVYGVCNQVEMPIGWRETNQASFDWAVGFVRRNRLSPTVVQGLSYKNNSSNNSNSASIKSQYTQLPKLTPISTNSTPNGKETKKLTTNEANGNANSSSAVTPIEIDD